MQGKLNKPKLFEFVTKFPIDVTIFLLFCSDSNINCLRFFKMEEKKKRFFFRKRFKKYTII